MKTISEMQLLIKDAYSKMDELSKSLSEYSLSEYMTVTVDFEKLKAVGKRNSIDGHLLLKVDEVTKKQYITLLIALVYLAVENQEKGWLLIQRIACGAEVKSDLSDLSVDAISLKEKQLDSFSESIISNDLRTMFALDCMIVYLCCEHKNRKMLDFISKMMELVKCKEMEVKEISKIAGLIATQNSKEYFECCLKNMNVKLSESLCYIMPTNAAVVNNLNEAGSINNEHVIISNATISNLNCEINLDDFHAKTIEFFYCKFENISGVKSKNKRVIFRNTIFQNIAPKVESNESFSIIEISNCELQSCDFINCSSSKHFIRIEKGSILNCVFEQCSGVDTPSDIYLIELIRGDIKNCKFDKCSISIKRESCMSTITGIVKLTQGKIQNSNFIECKCYSSYGGILSCQSYILYLSNSNAEECDFIKCNCTTTDSSEINNTNYIIALQNSNEKNNKFTECSSHQYRFGEIGSEYTVGEI